MVILMYIYTGGKHENVVVVISVFTLFIFSMTHRDTSIA